MSRVTSAFFVSALIRRAQGEGAFGTVLRRGAEEAGSIFVVVRSREALLDLYAPAPQGSYEDGEIENRLFERRDPLSDAALDEFIDREVRFDADIWVVEIEDSDARSFLELAADD